MTDSPDTQTTLCLSRPQFEALAALLGVNATPHQDRADTVQQAIADLVPSTRSEVAIGFH